MRYNIKTDPKILLRYLKKLICTFFADRHLCLFDAGGSNSGNGGDPTEKQCIVCEMARLFQVC